MPRVSHLASPKPQRSPLRYRGSATLATRCALPLVSRKWHACHALRIPNARLAYGMSCVCI
eukprot:995959-Pyramimonas_sp.AAC.1